MAEKISRRKMMGLAAGAAVSTLPGCASWIFKVDEAGEIVRAPEQRAGDWTPRVFSAEQAETVAVVCETIIPRTDTPGARDARVHEYIDLALTVEPQARQERFIEGLDWLNRRSRNLYDRDFSDAAEAQRVELLSSISDEHESHPEELALGAGFFRDVKRRTIFGYYTSKVGRVEELRLPSSITMEIFRGCPDSSEHV